MAATLKTRAVAAKDKALELLEAAKTKVRTLKAEVDKSVADGMVFAHGKAAAAKKAVCGFFGGTLATVHEAKVTVRGYAGLVQAAIVGTLEEVKQKGIKAWTAETASHAAGQARGAAVSLTNAAAEKVDSAKNHAAERAAEAAEFSKAKASEWKDGVRSVAGDQKFQVSAASAASGAVTLGASGGATGLAAGGAAGAAIGLVPALFTFGLSIPIGATIGGSAGLVIGTLVGGTVGAVGGGAAGYGVYSKKDNIGKAAEYVKARAAETTELVKAKAAETTDLVKGTSTAALGRAREAADYTKSQAFASAGYVAEKASAAKSRLVGRSGTGGTEAEN